MGVALGEIGDRLHLLGGGVARRAALRLERQRNDGVAGHLVIGDRVAHPGIEPAIGASHLRQRGRAVLEPLVGRVAEAGGDLGKHRGIERQRAVLHALPFRLDFLGERFDAEVVHQDLDARLPGVVAPSELVVGAQHRLDVAQHVALRQERLDRLGEERRTAEAAADHDFETGLAGAVAMEPQRHVVNTERGAVVRRRPHRDLELARHERELGMQRHVLADHLRPDARILDLVRRHAGPLVGRDVANIIA